MDPITLFALANGAVAAVKAGCKLYKDIKGAAGDIKDVLKDLDDQFHKVYDGKGKTPPPAAIKQLNEEKEKVRDLNRRSNDTTNIYQEIGDHLGTYFDNFYKCMAVFEEEERRAKTEVYSGDASLGKRALQRVLMRKQLAQMEAELRELMVYQSPSELGALYTEVFEMMEVMGKEQKVLIARQMKADQANAIRRKKRIEKLRIELAWGVAVIFIILVVLSIFSWLVQSRIEMYPQYGTEWLPKTEEERRREAGPHVYIGR
jgi:hypothetical protein